MPRTVFLLRYFLSLCLFLVCLLSFSQDREFIRGQLIDAKTGDPIVFASIYLENNNMGVVSNLDGGFKIPIKYREMGSVLIISSMGYQTEKRLIFDLSRFKLNLIRLNPAIFELKEAIVKAKKEKIKTAEEIVQLAIDKILENHPNEPYSQVGYYRDYQIKQGEYVNLNESILEVFDQGFKAIDSSTTKVLLYDYKENADFQRDTLSRRPYNYSFKGEAKIIDNGYLSPHGGNEFTILNVHNAIRNYQINTYSFVHRFKTDLIKEHQFFKGDDSSIGEELLYTIQFSKKLPNHSAYGTLYISKYNYSIFKMEYAVYDETKKNSTGRPDKNGNTNELMFEINTSYRESSGKMYLNYISFYNLFKLWEPPKLKLEFVDFRFDKKPNYKFKSTKVNSSFLVLTFNKFLDSTSVDNINKFSIKYKRKKIPLERLKVSDREVILYPKLNTRKQIERFNEIELIARHKGLNEKVIQIEIKDIQDIDGNVFGEWTTEDYNQFREFFVQEIKPNSFSPVDKEFMNKNTPIFQDQPIVKPYNFNDYWMNTPLKSIKN